ncbi:hypothetical protein ACFVAJ_16710 [Agromyces sp. NPDC057679]|uniref:hypothetical protein n=1 Tax=Agromyces sp. NPDC057679 TaxID=3346207 RepID=UPI00366B3271
MPKKNTHSIWDDTELAESPNVKSKPVQSSEAARRVMRGYTHLAVWSFPVTAVLLAMVWVDMPNPDEFKMPTITDQVDSPGKAEAIIATDAWLASVPAPIVDGHVVSWDGFRDIDRPKLDELTKKAVTTPGYDIEMHRFTIADAAGNRYTSEVAVAVSKREGAVALSTPSLSPLAPSATGWASTGTWYGLQTATASDEVQVAVTDWAEAFASGDPGVLRQRVGDEASNHSYMPLNGVASVEASVITAGSRPVIEDGVVSDDDPKELIAQVQLKLVWLDSEGNPRNDKQNSSGNSVITYDVLIAKANTASPQVVAWGGPGSGTSLEKFQNAVIDRELTDGEDN